MVHILTFLGRKDGRKKENFRKEFGKQADTGIDTGRKQVEATRFPSHCEESIFYILGAKVERRGELTRFQNQIRPLDSDPCDPISGSSSGPLTTGTGPCHGPI